jgi:hypothetical protein
MARWHSRIPLLIAAVLLTACGTAMPGGSGLTVQMNGNLGNPYGGRAQPNQVTLPNGLDGGNLANPYGGRAQPYQVTLPNGLNQPPGSQYPQQYPPQQPTGPAVPPASQLPRQYPPLQPGGTIGALGLDSCIQSYMRSINFFVAPTEQQLAGLREQARQRCLSSSAQTEGRLPM